MRFLPFVLALLSAQAEIAERVTRPTFQGQGDGTLTVVSVPENVPLEFYTVRCESAGGEAATFSVTRSGDEATPPTSTVGQIYRETERGISFRIDKGEQLFAVGDRFSFVTYPDLSSGPPQRCRQRRAAPCVAGQVSTGSLGVGMAMGLSRLAPLRRARHR